MIPQLENPDQYVFISLEVQTTSTPATLAAYADRNGFTWIFVVMTPELLAALSNDFGRSINNPPSTPRFLIAPGGTVSPLFTGGHSPQDELDRLREYSG